MWHITKLVKWTNSTSKLDPRDQILIVFILTVLNCFLSDGSFSESLYGLRRRPVKVSVKRKSPGTESSDKVYDSALRKRQKILSVVFLVGCGQFYLHTAIFCLLCSSFLGETYFTICCLATAIKRIYQIWYCKSTWIGFSGSVPWLEFLNSLHQECLIKIELICLRTTD